MACLFQCDSAVDDDGGDDDGDNDDSPGARTLSTRRHSAPQRPPSPHSSLLWEIPLLEPDDEGARSPQLLGIETATGCLRDILPSRYIPLLLSS